jgi:3-methylcrotonyl-CoA carboxylase alpha subunit
MEQRFRWQGKEVSLELSGAGEASVARREGREIPFHKLAEEVSALVLEVAGRKRRIAFARDGTAWLLSLDGIAYRIERVDLLAAAAGHSHHEQGLEAPMPGLVRRVAVAVGERVARAQTLVVLEAMKMEIRITAPYPARVTRLHCAAGAQVERGQVLVELDAESESSG